MERRAHRKQAFCPFIHPNPLGSGKRSNMHLFEYGHAAYQKEGTYACSNMVTSVVPEDTPRLRGGSKDKNIFFF